MATNGNFNGLTSSQVVGTLKASDAVPVTLAEQLRGSLRTVASITERDAIPGRKLDNGMIVFVESTGTHYVYKDGTRVTTTGIMSGGNWSTFTSGSGGSGSGAGLQEFSATSGYSVNDVILFSGSFYFTDRDIVTTGTCVISGSTDKTNQTAAQCSTDGGVYTADTRPNPGVVITTLVNGSTAGNITSLTVDSTADFPYAGVISLENGSTFVYSSSTSTTFDGESQSVGSLVADNSTVTFDDPWNAVALNLVEKWDGSALVDDKGNALTGDAIATSQTLARASLGGNATVSVDGFMGTADKIQLRDLPETWVSGKTYNPGDQVSFRPTNSGTAKVYVNIAASAGSTTNDPSVAASATVWRQTGLVPAYVKSSTGSSRTTTVTMADSRTSIPNFEIAEVNSTDAGVMSVVDKTKLDTQVSIWDVGTGYSRGDQVARAGILYVSVSVTTNTGNDPTTVKGSCSVSNVTTRAGCDTAGGIFTPIWDELGVIDLTVSTQSSTIKVRSSTGNEVTIPAADDSNAGVMSQADKEHLISMPQEWSSASVLYAVGTQVTFGEKLYAVLREHTSTTSSDPTVSTNPETFTVIGGTDIFEDTDATNRANDFVIGSANGSGLTIKEATTTIAGVLSASDKVLVDTIVNRWNTSSVATAYSSTTTYNVNDKVSHEGVVYISVSSAAHSGNTPSSTSTVWTEMITYLESRDLGIFSSDPTNLRDGQVWYNSTEDFIKYFTAIDLTNYIR